MVLQMGKLLLRQTAQLGPVFLRFPYQVFARLRHNMIHQFAIYRCSDLFGIMLQEL